MHAHVDNALMECRSTRAHALHNKRAASISEERDLIEEAGMRGGVLLAAQHLDCHRGNLPEHGQVHLGAHVARL